MAFVRHENRAVYLAENCCMGTYLVRRLLIMIPTLFGITVVSFCIMQLAPGDPVANQVERRQRRPIDRNADDLCASQAGAASRQAAAAEFQLLSRLSPKEFDWRGVLRGSARSIRFGPSLPELAAATKSPPTIRKRPRGWRFSDRLGIPDFDARLADPEQWDRLAEAIEHYVGKFCGDTGRPAFPAQSRFCKTPQADKQLKIGAIRCLVQNGVRAVSSTPTRSRSTDADTPEVIAAWQLWWDRNKADLPKPDAEARKYFDGCLAQMVVSHDELYTPRSTRSAIAITCRWRRPISPRSSWATARLQEKVAASTILKQLFPSR